MKEFKLCTKRKEILISGGHILIEGGPGAGKTTIALLKAQSIINSGVLKPNQKILFLSFARQTISRVEEQANHIVTKEDKKKIEINTYHGFCWSIIQSFGYLLTSNKYFKLLTPPNESALLADIEEDKHDKYLLNLFENDGQISFRLFAKLTTEIIEKSKRICSLISTAYPFLIVDEFQDTDVYEWKLIQLLGIQSKIIALADLNQRIFEFRGASITRIPEFTKKFTTAVRFDLGTENNRSSNTDIVQYGDDLLLGINQTKVYKNVNVIKYPFYREQKSPLRFELLRSLDRVKKNNANHTWSIAILVKTKIETLAVSSYLSSYNIYHDVLIDPAGPSLSASVIAQILEPPKNKSEAEHSLIKGLINHIRGRKSKLTIKDNQLIKALESYLLNNKISGVQRKKLIEEIKGIIDKRYQLNFLGIPEDDWLLVRKLFQDCSHEVLKNVYEDARFLRLLNKGAVLSETLAEIWRKYRNYQNATIAVNAALTQEHFSMAHRLWKGVIIMNLHKSKGKEFDEVIIWEELYKPIVYPDATENRKQADRILLRVGVTRAKAVVTILTPQHSPGILF